ncbi:hypothetical protein [Tardiphaga sp.]|jgi:hypothetical protein|uniref:hypothetical protein n=1 Tax=Tardiphaga sp. TaxID=1926292 RepID=UPI0037DA1C3C
MVEQTEGWLIVKRDLYYAPDCRGYTGFRDRAGRYDLAFARAHEGHGCTIAHESAAPEFRQAAYSDKVIEHLIEQRDEARAERDAAARDMRGRCKAVAMERLTSLEKLRDDLHTPEAKGNVQDSMDQVLIVLGAIAALPDAVIATDRGTTNG